MISLNNSSLAATSMTPPTASTITSSAASATAKLTNSGNDASLTWLRESANQTTRGQAWANASRQTLPPLRPSLGWDELTPKWLTQGIEKFEKWMHSLFQNENVRGVNWAELRPVLHFAAIVFLTTLVLGFALLLYRRYLRRLIQSEPAPNVRSERQLNALDELQIALAGEDWCKAYRLRWRYFLMQAWQEDARASLTPMEFAQSDRRSLGQNWQDLHYRRMFGAVDVKQADYLKWDEELSQTLTHLRRSTTPSGVASAAPTGLPS